MIKVILWAIWFLNFCFWTIAFIFSINALIKKNYDYAHRTVLGMVESGIAMGLCAILLNIIK